MRQTIKCGNCESEWTVKEGVLSTISKCPFCGVTIVKEKKDYASVSQGIQAIFAVYGKEVLVESKRFYSLLTDYIPEKERELKVLKMACDEEVFVSFATLKESQVEVEEKKAVKRLMDDCMLAENWANQAVAWVIEALGYSVVRETAAEVKEVVKPQNPIPQPVVPTQPDDKQKTSPQSVNPQKQGVAISCDINDFVIKGTTLVKYVGKSANIKIPSSVKTIKKGAFSACGSLESVIIPGSVTSIEAHAFQFCINLTSIVIPDSVTNIANNAFWCCFSLSKVVVGGGITELKKQFSGLSIKEVEIRNGVTTIGRDAFRGCGSLESVIIPESVTSIEEFAFRNCKNLTSIVIPDSVTNLASNAFLGCTSLSKIILKSSDKTALWGLRKRLISILRKRLNSIHGQFENMINFEV